MSHKDFSVEGIPYRVTAPDEDGEFLVLEALPGRSTGMKPVGDGWIREEDDWERHGSFDFGIEDVVPGSYRGMEGSPAVGSWTLENNLPLDWLIERWNAARNKRGSGQRAGRWSLPVGGDRIEISAPVQGMVGRYEYDIPVGAVGTVVHSEGAEDGGILGVELDAAFALPPWVREFNREEGLHPHYVELAWWEKTDPTRHSWVPTGPAPGKPSAATYRKLFGGTATAAEKKQISAYNTYRRELQRVTDRHYLHAAWRRERPTDRREERRASAKARAKKAKKRRGRSNKKDLPLPPGWEESPVTRGEMTLEELLDPTAQARRREEAKGPAKEERLLYNRNKIAKPPKALFRKMFAGKATRTEKRNIHLWLNQERRRHAEAYRASYKSSEPGGKAKKPRRRGRRSALLANPIVVHSIGFPGDPSDREIRRWLKTHGFPSPILIDRGQTAKAKYAWARLRDVDSFVNRYRTKHWPTDTFGRVAVRYAVPRKRKATKKDLLLALPAAMRRAA